MRKLLLIFIGLAATAGAQTPMPAKRALQVADWYRLRTVSDAQRSPDGAWVAYAVSHIDSTKDRHDSDIYMTSWDGATTLRLTASDESETSPRWSPDGASIAFSSTRNSDTVAQIWQLPMNGGEAHVVTHLKNGVNSFQWSPDGKRFIVVSRTGPGDGFPADFKKTDVRHYSHISYKFNDTGWYDDRRSHLWVVLLLSDCVPLTAQRFCHPLEPGTLSPCPWDLTHSRQDWLRKAGTSEVPRQSRPLSWRSGCIPAEPYPPLSSLASVAGVRLGGPGGHRGYKP